MCQSHRLEGQSATLTYFDQQCLEISKAFINVIRSKYTIAMLQNNIG